MDTWEEIQRVEKARQEAGREHSEIMQQAGRMFHDARKIFRADQLLFLLSAKAGRVVRYNPYTIATQPNYGTLFGVEFRVLSDDAPSDEPMIRLVFKMGETNA